jgi:hypothetical protein
MNLVACDDPYAPLFNLDTFRKFNVSFHILLH